MPVTSDLCHSSEQHKALPAAREKVKAAEVSLDLRYPGTGLRSRGGYGLGREGSIDVEVSRSPDRK